MRFSRELLIVAAVAVALAAAGCWNPFDPKEDPPTGPQYWENCDSAWKVVENLQFSYTARNIDRYLACFRDDFEFFLLEVDFDDYDGDGIEDQSWGLDLEEQFTIQMFNLVTSIELTLWGGYEVPWTGDPSGETVDVMRLFDLKVYTDESGTQGFRANGQVNFYCRPDSTGQYYIWQWWDHSAI